MMFCPKCGAIMLPKKEKEKTILACSCGYAGKSNEKIEIKEEIKNNHRETQIVDEQETNLPETETECPKCGNKKAGYWLVQTRAGDEPETKFLKCTKCRHTWRDYH